MCMTSEMKKKNFNDLSSIRNQQNGLFYSSKGRIKGVCTAHFVVLVVCFKSPINIILRELRWLKWRNNREQQQKKSANENIRTVNYKYLVYYLCEYYTHIIFSVCEFIYYNFVCVTYQQAFGSFSSDSDWLLLLFIFFSSLVERSSW